MKYLLILVVLAGCSGPLWDPEPRNSDDGTISITFEMPSVIDIPWVIQPGQSAHYTAGVWYLYQDGLVIDSRAGY